MNIDFDIFHLKLSIDRNCIQLTESWKSFTFFSSFFYIIIYGVNKKVYASQDFHLKAPLLWNNPLLFPFHMCPPETIHFKSTSDGSIWTKTFLCSSQVIPKFNLKLHCSTTYYCWIIACYTYFVTNLIYLLILLS